MTSDRKALCVELISGGWPWKLSNLKTALEES